jgi:hypothetical protein
VSFGVIPDTTTSPSLTQNNSQENTQSSDLNTSTFPCQRLKGFKIGNLNIASLIKHIDELRIFMHDQKFDILSINETRLDDTIDNNEVEIKGYDLTRRDRNRNGGGGV